MNFQVGSKPECHTDLDVYLLMQTVVYYANKGTPLHEASFDASKAFDTAVCKC